MAKEHQMTNKETAAHFRQWFEKSHGPFAWPIDACGYNQHVRFVQYRNENWNESCPFADFKSFALDYASKIENDPDTRCKCIYPNVKATHTCYCCDEPSCKFNGLTIDGRTIKSIVEDKQSK